jgi:hypothetical protein
MCQPTVGDELPPITRTLDRLHLVLYAAGAGDFNPPALRSRLPPGPRDRRQHCVRPTQVRRARPAGFRLARAPRLHPTYLRLLPGMDRRGQPFTCRGRVTGLREEHGQSIIELELWTEGADGQHTTEGIAEVALTPTDSG